MSFPVYVNGHKVAKKSPTTVMRWSGRLEADPETAFVCRRCDHEMNPPNGRIEDEQWARNAFDSVDCPPSNSAPSADNFGRER